ncbi:MAG: MarR family EPS-associated transcriptional regulator [Acidiferrobacteraceae bacterium]|nr:MarR family EPS-associated transcriptional regulator [Acidiferrobacteraceae bacterium]|tara:strand:- start:771 stop:1091 length:321 start_codon:yes stop_codon:yes gene_type:complete
MKTHQSDNEYSLLKILKDNPEMTQRQLSRELGLSLGQTNYLLQALRKKGLMKLSNFRRSDNKVGYLYLITPKGIEEKAILAKKFLERKSAEYNRLKKEIEILKGEL